jgi:hypothetical protein
VLDFFRNEIDLNKNTSESKSILQGKCNAVIY